MIPDEILREFIGIDYHLFGLDLQGKIIPGLSL
jgi:hypothetical protein